MAIFEKLISSGLSRPRDILQALVNAHTKTPAVEAIALAEQWLDEATLLKVLTLQIEQSCSFEEASRRAGAWSSELSERIEAHGKLVRQRVGLELSAATGVDTRIIAIACGKFFDPKAAPAAKAIAPVPADASPISPVSLDTDVLTDFLEIFDDGRHAFFEEQLLALESSAAATDYAEQNEERLRRLYRDFHTLKGSARFLRARLTEHLVHVAEDVLSFVQQFGSRLTADERREIFNGLLEAVDVVWNLRGSIEKDGAEETRWADPEFQRKYRRSESELRALKVRLDAKGLSVELKSLEGQF